MHQKIRRFDVAVHHALAVGVVQALGSLADELTSLADGKRPLAANQLFEVGAVHVLHHQVMEIAVFVGIQGGDNVGVHQLRGGAHLALEEVARPGRLDQTRRENFQGDDASQGAMLCLENSTHAALADLFEDAVLSHQETGRSTGQHLFGLETRQKTLLDKGPGNHSTSVGVGQLGRQRSQLGRIQQTRTAQTFQECVPINGRHAHVTPPHPRRGSPPRRASASPMKTFLPGAVCAGKRFSPPLFIRRNK